MKLYATDKRHYEFMSGCDAEIDSDEDDVLAVTERMGTLNKTSKPVRKELSS